MNLTKPPTESTDPSAGPQPNRHSPDAPLVQTPPVRPWYRFWQLLLQVLFSAFFSVRVFGRHHVPNHGPVLLVGNHQSFLDPPLLGMCLHREIGYAARATLFRNRLFGRFIRSVNTLPVHRPETPGDATAKNLAAIKTIIKQLRSGWAIALFPEGTRSADGRIQPIKNGVDLIARRSGATVVPVVIDGAHEAWPRHRLIPMPGRINILFGKPIDLPPARSAASDALENKIHLRLIEMQSQIRRRSGKEPYTYDHTPTNDSHQDKAGK